MFLLDCVLRVLRWVWVDDLAGCLTFWFGLYWFGGAFVIFPVV